MKKLKMNKQKKMKIIKNIEQGTDEWFELRRGRLTASNAQTIAANGKGLETYIYQILAEKYSNHRDDYTNPDIERGRELEDSARMTYTLERQEVEEVALVEMDELVSCSPDGLVGEDGGLEIKCVNDTNFMKILIGGEKQIDKKFYWQCQMCLLVTGRSWWDLAIYNQNFDKNLLVFRQYPNQNDFAKLQAGINQGKLLLQQLEAKFLNNN